MTFAVDEVCANSNVFLRLRARHRSIERLMLLGADCANSMMNGKRAAIESFTHCESVFCLYSFILVNCRDKLEGFCGVVDVDIVVIDGRIRRPFDIVELYKMLDCCSRRFCCK
ncbi:hypothetical protein CDV36_016449 [Fusarium kuroshium]|uniref:Uncharacterized protein n=1 Tax=Fusarium kuroshium TaxID=2010991 RepID=A0A3M2QP46_9HYPO|nr:hypothetical protein CDV36_016449 [Fusarium kuroshium]